jgi:hypothetical protein
VMIVIEILSANGNFNLVHQRTKGVQYRTPFMIMNSLSYLKIISYTLAQPLVNFAIKSIKTKCISYKCHVCLKIILRSHGETC